MRNLKLGIATLAVVGSVLPSAAEIYPRASTPDGSVISRKSGEEVRFIDISNWRSVEVNQDLLAGDTLRTNANGQLAILFADRTQMRMGRNTTLLVKKIDGTANSEFELKSGVLWGRAGRGGSGLTIETPAAAAAIRGTDWNLRVGGNGETTLSVLEGTVELYNAQGSVTVNQGEGAYAAIGQAPRKYVLVDLEEREQILLYGELRDAFATLPISGLGTTQTRAERLRILEKSPDTRTPEDWVALAEVALGEEGRAAARDALAQLRRPLPSPLEARAKLVEAMIAGQELRYAEAARLFAEAAPSLPRNRRAAAAYGRWFAESLADPDGHATPPSEGAYGDDPTAALARAIAVFFTRGQVEAIEILREAEKRFPEDARLPAMRADLAFQLDRREEVQEALARARAIDPDDASSLLISARYRTSVSSDLDGALKELTRAAEVAPGSDAVWNEIGLVQSERNAIVEADAAHQLAISLNPESAVLRANYARFLLDNDQVKAAKAEIDIAESLDPQSYAVLAAKGRYLLRIGKTTEGEQVLLEASAVNPTYGDSLIGIAIASYQLGSDAEATQALDNADRFDRDNPSIPLIRAGIAMDQYRADDAIIQAREALRRREARGGFYSGYDANRQANSYLGVTLDNLGLSEWGQYYAARSRDLFKSSTYLDEAADGRVSPFIGYYPLLSPDERIQGGSGTVSSVMQGRILDPLFVASETRRNSLETRSFFEGGIGGGFNSIGGETGWFSDILLQGTNYSTIPLSYYFQGVTSHPQSERTNDENNLEGAVFELGMRPSLTDGIFLFANTRNVERGFPGQSDFPTPFDERTTKVREVGGAWNHVISDENVIQAFAVASRTHTDQSFYMENSYGPFMVEQSFRDKNLTYGVSHLFGVGPLTVRYGPRAAASIAKCPSIRGTSSGISASILWSFRATATRPASMRT
ncbi:FecR domain-containing protein [Sinorhizobium sp. BG8]|uniref:FecR domain-containing protein n=1 Tax=Sinorhizobium sp. BG8 TaxID=2613773 RepID=UPI001FEE8B3E|nr:FecR domain-containing protein [Sinorhizobium sp. BG8]